jgi:protein CWC15
MSTAGRPTWNAAKGANRYFAPSAAVSGKDQRGHTKLKTRQTGQNSANEVKQRNLKAELAAREKKYKASKEHKDVMGTKNFRSLHTIAALLFSWITY